MYYLLKFFDKWDPIKLPKPIAFENFVLDTRYTGNLLVLTILVAGIGLLVYLIVSWLLRSKELYEIANSITKRGFWIFPKKEVEPLSPIEEGRA